MTSMSDDMPLSKYARPVVVAPTTAAGVLAMSGDVILTGWSFAETTGAGTALVELYDGGNANGTLVAVIGLQANETVRDLTSRWGLEIRSGLFVNVVSGTARGVVWTVDLS